MNLTKMIESLEIFKKYEVSEDNEEATLDSDYRSICVFLDNTFIEAHDLERLAELGWKVLQKPSYSHDGAHYTVGYKVNKIDKGHYAFSLRL